MKKKRIEDLVRSKFSVFSMVRDYDKRMHKKDHKTKLSLTSQIECLSNYEIKYQTILQHAQEKVTSESEIRPKKVFLVNIRQI